MQACSSDGARRCAGARPWGWASSTRRSSSGASQQEAGAIESFETVLLEPHGGDLAGFFLVRGTQEQIAAARASEDFRRLNTRANMIVEGFGIVGAILGDGLGDAIGLYAAAASEFGG